MKKILTGIILIISIIGFSGCGHTFDIRPQYDSTTKQLNIIDFPIENVNKYSLIRTKKFGLNNNSIVKHDDIYFQIQDSLILYKAASTVQRSRLRFSLLEVLN